MGEWSSRSFFDYFRLLSKPSSLSIITITDTTTRIPLYLGYLHCVSPQFLLHTSRFTTSQSTLSLVLLCWTVTSTLFPSVNPLSWPPPKLLSAQSIFEVLHIPSAWHLTFSIQHKLSTLYLSFPSHPPSLLSPPKPKNHPLPSYYCTYYCRNHHLSHPPLPIRLSTRFIPSSVHPIFGPSLHRKFLSPQHSWNSTALSIPGKSHPQATRPRANHPGWESTVSPRIPTGFSLYPPLPLPWHFRWSDRYTCTRTRTQTLVDQVWLILLSSSPRYLLSHKLIFLVSLDCFVSPTFLPISSSWLLLDCLCCSYFRSRWYWASGLHSVLFSSRRLSTIPSKPPDFTLVLPVYSTFYSTSPAIKVSLWNVLHPKAFFPYSKTGFLCPHSSYFLGLMARGWWCRVPTVPMGCM